MTTPRKIESVDICCGLCWGDEAKGKVIAHLAKVKDYDFVCRWAGGNNAGHTVYVNGVKYKTHIIPCGIFYGKPSIIGPECVIHKESFLQEIDYLRENGFNIDLIKISEKAHIITNKHIEDDIRLYNKQGTTSRGIAPCYRDKYARVGIQVKGEEWTKPYLWDNILYGNILCEGAQGFWLDINYGNYPYVTSSTTLPYGACSLGFSPRLIRNIYGACKIYDTRSGNDPEFPESLLIDPELSQIVDCGKEYGTTTGRKRKVNWLNLDKLIDAINISGTTILIVSKVDVMEIVGIYKLIHNESIQCFNCLQSMKKYIDSTLRKKCPLMETIIYSSSKESL